MCVARPAAAIIHPFRGLHHPASRVARGYSNANRSKDMWGADALEWKPERWLAPLPQSVADAHMPGVYSNLMTFLGGGRACIGFKFAQLEMKVALVELLDAFKLSPSNRIVRWRMSNISSAYVEDAPQKSQLPIVLSRAK
ncbi:hypothetical protein GGG16DRAFT_110973 [Schizophyllum commune]